jgi:hypothetical protein
VRENGATAEASARLHGPEPYGDGVALGAGSGWSGIRTDRTAGQRQLDLPVGDARCNKARCTKGGSRRQIRNGNAHTETACETAGATMLVGLRGCALLIVVRVRAGNHDRGSKTLGAPPDQNNSTDKYQQESRERPHNTTSLSSMALCCNDPRGVAVAGARATHS